MPIGEILLTAIADAVFGYLLDKHGEKLVDRIRDKTGRDLVKKAFKAAFGKAFADFEQKHPQWVEEHFNASFFEHEGASILAQFLMRDGHPDPSELATRWADSLNMRRPERRTFYIRELEPVATDFLNIFAHYLKAQKVLRELHDSRAFEQLASDIRAIRQQLEAEQATPGTRNDYLRWLIARNLYIDTRGTFQTQRQVQVKLEEVYVSLRAQYEGTSDTATQDPWSDVTIEAGQDWEAAISLALKPLDVLIQSVGRVSRSKSSEILELAEAVGRHDRLIILGDPGSGKTTLLRYLALKHAQALYAGRSEASPELGSVRFPILIRIAEYTEDGAWKKQSLSDFLANTYRRHECPAQGLADLLHSELRAGNCLILLDGLDEIIDADERRGVVQQIEDFVRRHIDQGNRFVITSRIAGYNTAPLGEPFTRYTAQEMDEEQIRRFLERWCQAIEDAQTPEAAFQERRRVAQREIDGIMKAIHDSPGVRRLAANPLLLRTLALIHRTGAQLPQKRVELYKLAADTLARTWRAAQGVPESALIKDEYLTPMLSKLAYWLHLNKSTSIATEHEVYQVLGEEWARINELKWDVDDPSPTIAEEIKKFLLAVREHTGLFVERAPSQYGFMHLTFEEYYAARYLVARSRTRAKLIRTHLLDPRWEEPILLALGFVGLEYPAEAAALLETAILAEGRKRKSLVFPPARMSPCLDAITFTRYVV